MSVWVIPRFCEPVRERKAEFFLIGGGGELAPLVQDFWLFAIRQQTARGLLRLRSRSVLLGFADW